jgi:hypothetical protein
MKVYKISKELAKEFGKIFGDETEIYLKQLINQVFDTREELEEIVKSGLNLTESQQKMILKDYVCTIFEETARELKCENCFFFEKLEPEKPKQTFDKPNTEKKETEKKEKQIAGHCYLEPPKPFIQNLLNVTFYTIYPRIDANFKCKHFISRKDGKDLEDIRAEVKKMKIE